MRLGDWAWSFRPHWGGGSGLGVLTDSTGEHYQDDSVCLAAAPTTPRLNPCHHAAIVLEEAALFLVRAEGTLVVFLIAFLEGFF